MSDIEEEEVITDGISFEGGAKAELLATMRVKDDLEFGGGDAVSRASGFAGSEGNSTHRSTNSKRMAVAKEVNKQLQDKTTELEKENKKQKDEMLLMQERMRAMTANLANQPGAGLQGTPHLSGSSAPGEPPHHQENDVVSSGAEQV